MVGSRSADLREKVEGDCIMDLFAAMRPDNAAEVVGLINSGADVNSHISGLTVLEYAACEYMSQIESIGNLTSEANVLATEWASTIDPLVQTGKLQVKEVTKGAWDSERTELLPTALALLVDRMLHELGVFDSKIAISRGYQRRFTEWQDLQTK